MVCNPCHGYGWKNLDGVPDEVQADGCDAITAWVAAHPDELPDLCPCDCCGNGEVGGWYGEPGHHYGGDDPIGRNGPYAYNGGLCECH